MTSIRAKRYAYPRIAVPKQNEEIKQLKQRVNKCPSQGKSLPKTIAKEIKPECEPWHSLSEMSAWGFHGSYLNVVHGRLNYKEKPIEPKEDKTELLKVINKRIRERNLERVKRNKEFEKHN